MKKKWKKILMAAACTVMLLSGTSSLAAENVMNNSCAPAGIAETGDGSLLVTDTYHKVIWKVKDGQSSVFAGTPGAEGMYGEPEGGYRDDNLNRALFGNPWAIVPFKGGYAVSDPANNVIRLLGDNKVRTVNLSKVLSNPTGLAADAEGCLYIADTNHNQILKVTANGSASVWLSGLSEPTGLYYQNGSLYIADSGNNRIVKAVSGKISSVMGGTQSGYLDGALQNSLFANPMAIAVDLDGTIYVADTGNSAIRKIQGNTVSTLLVNKGSESENFSVSPVSLQLVGNNLYICDIFSREMIAIPKEQGVTR